MKLPSKQMFTGIIWSKTEKDPTTSMCALCSWMAFFCQYNSQKRISGFKTLDGFLKDIFWSKWTNFTVWS